MWLVVANGQEEYTDWSNPRTQLFGLLILLAGILIAVVPAVFEELRERRKATSEDDDSAAS